MAKQNFVQETVQVFGTYDGGTLEQVLARIKGCVDKVPEEYRSSIRFELETTSAYYETRDYPVFNMTYNRLENEKEKHEREREAFYLKQAQERREREEYERLQKKFGK